MNRHDDEIRQKAVELRRQRYGNSYIARELGIGRATVYRWLGPTPSHFAHLKPVNAARLRRTGRQRGNETSVPTRTDEHQVNASVVSMTKWKRGQS